MTSFRLANEINCSPEQVFALFTAFEDLPRYLPSVRQAQRLDSGPLNVGSRFRQVRRLWDGEEQQEFEIADWRPGQGYTMRYRYPDLLVELRYSFTPTAGGTQVELDCNLSGRRTTDPLLSLAVEAMRADYDAELYRLHCALIGSAA